MFPKHSPLRIEEGGDGYSKVQRGNSAVSLVPRSVSRARPSTSAPPSPSLPPAATAVAAAASIPPLVPSAIPTPAPEPALASSRRRKRKGIAGRNGQAAKSGKSSRFPPEFELRHAGASRGVVRRPDAPPSLFPLRYSGNDDVVGDSASGSDGDGDGGGDSDGDDGGSGSGSCSQRCQAKVPSQ
ncbi:hypothetical protein V1478_016805 [Vespula squamosa]|uniref:Uncharacterized protein n=1 Tax=Vespula squamosa TaxID=30214 RepID=A0ABD2A0W9_VESSQ